MFEGLHLQGGSRNVRTWWFRGPAGESLSVSAQVIVSLLRGQAVWQNHETLGPVVTWGPLVPTPHSAGVATKLEEVLMCL